MYNTKLEVSDRDLVDRSCAGDETAFTDLLARHRAAIVAQSMRILRDHDDAETAAQEVALRVYRSLHRFNHDAQFTTWLYRITENVCRTMLAQRKRERAKREAFAQDPAMAREESVDTVAGDGALDGYLQGLENDEKQLLVLRFVHGCELRDIALIMGKGLSATKMRMYRALHKLQEQIEPQFQRM